MLRYTVRSKEELSLEEIIFNNRNVNINMKDILLNPSSSAIRNPLDLTNMREGVELLINHIKQNNRILVVVDCDVDGYLSAATILNYTSKELKYNNISYILQQDKKHGLNEHIMEQVLNIKPNLIIIPDAGSGDFEQHKVLKSNNIDCLVIDHHEADKLSEDALVINNQLSENYSNKTLSGAGIVLKFLEHLDTIVKSNNTINYHDLVAVALVADNMIMLDEETRFYVINGFRNIKNPLLNNFVKDKTIENVFEFVSFNVAPLLNAIIRVGEQEDKVKLLESMLYSQEIVTTTIRGKGEVDLSITEYIDVLGNRMKYKQNKLVQETLEDEDIELYDLAVVIVITNNEEIRNLTGLIGNKIADKFNKPALILRKSEDGNYNGSARGTKSFPKFKEYLENTNLFESCLGHQGAFGVSITQDNLHKFINTMKTEKLKEDEQGVLVDKEYINTLPSVYDIVCVDSLKELWSFGFEKPKFYIKLDCVYFNEISIIGSKKNTIKIVRDNMTFIKFNCNKTEIDEIIKLGTKDIEIIGSFNVNRWLNKITPQVIIDDFNVLELDTTTCYKLNDSNSFWFDLY